MLTRCYIALVRVAEPIALTSIFPYAWQLVIDFNVGDRANASFYAGLLISAFALAESLTGMYDNFCKSSAVQTTRRLTFSLIGSGEVCQTGWDESPFLSWVASVS